MSGVAALRRGALIAAGKLTTAARGAKGNAARLGVKELSLTQSGHSAGQENSPLVKQSDNPGRLPFPLTMRPTCFRVGSGVFTTRPLIAPSVASKPDTFAPEGDDWVATFITQVSMGGYKHFCAQVVRRLPDDIRQKVRLKNLSGEGGYATVSVPTELMEQYPALREVFRTGTLTEKMRMELTQKPSTSPQSVGVEHPQHGYGVI